MTSWSSTRFGKSTSTTSDRFSKHCGNTSRVPIWRNEILVSRIMRNIWYSSTTATYIDTSKTRWSSWTSPHSARRNNTSSRSSKSLNKRSNTLDLRFWSKGKVPSNYRTKEKAKVGRPKTTHEGHKQSKTLQSQKRTWESGVSSIRAPPTKQVSVGPRNH